MLCSSPLFILRNLHFPSLLLYLSLAFIKKYAIIFLSHSLNLNKINIFYLLFRSGENANLKRGMRMKTTKRLLMLVLAFALLMSLAVTASAEETHDPYLSFRWLEDQNQLWTQREDWKNDEHAASHNGYTDGWSTAAGDCVWQIYYLNTWNEETGTYDATPVHVDVNEYLTKNILVEGDFGFVDGAQDIEYYCQIMAHKDAWGEPAKVSYTMDDGTVLTMDCRIERYEPGFYTEAKMRDDTWLGNEYLYNRFQQENNVFYFGFQSEYWTFEKAEFSARCNSDFTLEDVAVIEDIGNSMYKISLKPEFVATGEYAFIEAQLFLKDPEGNSNNGDWTTGISVRYNWEEGADATIWMDQRYSFAEVNGKTEAFIEVPTDEFNGNGDEIHAVQKTTLPAGVSYDLSTNTLTLNNCDGDNYLHILQVAYDGGDHLPNENLTINLVGNNKIACDFMNAFTLRGGVKVTITGNGSLHLYADNKNCQDEHGNYFPISAIHMDWDTSLTIAGNAKVNAQVVGTALESCWEGETLLGIRTANIPAIRGNNGTLILKENGTLTTTLPEDARGNGPEVSEEDVIWGDRFPGGFRGIADMRQIRVEGGTLNTSELILSEVWNDQDQRVNFGTYTQTGGTVNITPIGQHGKAEQWDEENNCPAVDENGNPIEIDHIHYSGLGNHNGGTITISGGELNVNITASEEEKAGSVYGDTLFLGRTDEVDATPTLTISGGTVNLNNNAGAGISVDGIVDIKNGTVNVENFDSASIYAMEKLNISGGKITLTNSAEFGQGINANDCDVNISGGEITITASTPLMVGAWDTFQDDYKVDGFNGTLNVTGGKLTLNAGKDHAIALWPTGKATFTGGETIINGGVYYGGLSLWGNTTIGGNAVITLNEGGWGVFNVNSEEANPGTIKLTIQDNAVINLKDSESFMIADHCALIMNGGTLNFSTAFDYFSANPDFGDTNPQAFNIAPAGSMTVNGGAINATFKNNNARMAICGDYIQNGGTVTVTGTNTTAPTAEDWSQVFYMDRDSTLTVKGGELNIDAKNYHVSLFSNGNVTLEDGTVTIGNDCDGSSVTTYLGTAFAGKGINTINGGTLNITGDVGLEQSFDPGDPSVDWPGVPNTKLTVNDGEINIDAGFEGISVCAPTDINGGTFQIKAAGMLNPNNGRYPGRGITVYPNSDNESNGSMATVLNINNGFIGLDCGMGNNYFTIGLAAFAPTNINNGTILSDAAIALYAETDVEGGCLNIHELQNIISLTDGNIKQLLYGSYDFTDPELNETFTWYAHSIEEDNVSGDYLELLDQDHCSHLLITTSMCGDNAFWSLNDGVLTISGTGAMWDGFSGWAVADEFIKSVKVEEGITQTGIGSFAELGELTSISYPASLTKISEHTAARCTKLSTYTVAEGNKTFTVQDGIAIIDTAAKELVTVAPAYTGDFEVPENVTSIGSFAFEDCSGLGTVTIPGTVTKLGQNVFLNCGAVTVRTHHNSAAADYASQMDYPVDYIHEFGDATCEAPATCKYCEATTGTALGHDYADATCEAPATCKHCGATTGTALPHEYADATCTIPATCKHCGATTGTTLPHEYIGGNCEVPGTCKNCGAVGTTASHDFSPATCTVPGICRICGIAGPTLPHDYSEATCQTPATCKNCKATTGTTIPHEYSNATCTTPATCKFCKATIGTTLRHNFSNGWCTVCGTKEPSVTPINPFHDVTKDAYYYDAVLWAVDEGITNGLSATSFGPDVECNRGQVVTFLWRAAGSPEPTSKVSPFTDAADPNAFYYKAVLWAVEEGITNGLSATSFGPDVVCNRGQVVTFLNRYFGSPSASSTRNPFSDVKTGDFFYNAVLWANEKNITNGYGSATTFCPDVVCNRGQIVTFLYRAIN